MRLKVATQKQSFFTCMDMVIMGQDMPTSANISRSEDMNLQVSIREGSGTAKDMRVE